MNTRRGIVKMDPKNNTDDGAIDAGDASAAPTKGKGPGKGKGPAKGKAKFGGKATASPTTEVSDTNVFEAREAPNIKHELALTKLQLGAERERALLREDTISILKMELTRKEELVRDLVRNRSLDPPSSSGESSKARIEHQDMVLSSESPSESVPETSLDSLSDSDLEEKQRKRKKPSAVEKSKHVPRKAPKTVSYRVEANRVRVKNCRGILRRYRAILEVFRQGVSMKTALEETGNERQTIARTSVLVELCIAAPKAYEAIGEWNEKVEKLSAYVQRCRDAITPEIRARINEMKDSGELLPLA